MTDDYTIFKETLRYAQGPFSYEFIELRKDQKWRIADRHDDAIGSADSEAGARAAVAYLKKMFS